MIPDPPNPETTTEGGSGSPAGEGTGTNPSPARAKRCCAMAGCDRRQYRSDLCAEHHAEYALAKTTPQPENPVLVACPDKLLPLAAQAAENDARQIFMLLWRAIGDWHLQGTTA